MKKSTALIVLILIIVINFFLNDVMKEHIINITLPVYVVGYFIVKQLEENNKN